MKIAWANVLSTQPYLLRSLAVLEKLFTHCATPEKALIASNLAATYARDGFQSSTATWIEETVILAHEDDARVYYNLAWAAYYIREWEKALHFGNKALRLSPFWPRLRLATLPKRRTPPTRNSGHQSGSEAPSITMHQ